MRRLMLSAPAILFLALALTPRPASAQGAPAAGNGGLTVTLSPENGAPTATRALRTISQGIWSIPQWWLTPAAAPALRPIARSTFKGRPATARRNQARVR